MGAAPDPLTVTFNIGLDTPIGETGEDTYRSTPVTVIDAVIDRAAKVVADEAARTLHLSKELRARALQRVDTIVDTAVIPLVGEVLAGEVRRTNTYGEPVGPPATLRELVIEAARKQMTPGKNPGMSSQSRTSLDEAIASTVKAVVAKELADEIAAAKKVVRDALGQSVAETMAETITKAMAR